MDEPLPFLPLVWPRAGVREPIRTAKAIGTVH